jgi:hypothetical protein
MQLYYNQNEDRILLKLDTADKVVVGWLTRRQCLFLIEKGRESQKNSPLENTANSISVKKKPGLTKDKVGAIAKCGERAGRIKGLKCAVSPNAIKVSFATNDSHANVNLRLKDEDLRTFIDMLIKLASKANWGLTEALEYMEREKQDHKSKKTIH